MARSPEAKLQEEIVLDFNHRFPKFRGRLIAINNNSVNAIQGAQNTSKGVKKGVADMCFLCEAARVIWIELKVFNREQSPGQIRWQGKVESIGHLYKVCRSLKDFYLIIGGELHD
ncbi:MAG: hypothetical protein EOO20_01775 [Chryseobacterium sp.]|nr:MAG: hypothetical protein EOO20_01775 [Chryseobacterium sp.]